MKTSHQQHPERRTIQPEDLLQFKVILDHDISPDGQAIVYALQEVNPETLQAFVNLWTVKINSNSPEPLTHGPHMDSHPRWSPDGKTIAFLSNQGKSKGPQQLYVLNILEGEPRPLENIRGKVIHFEWSPDGDRLLLSLFLPEQKLPHTDHERPFTPISDAREIDRLFYRRDGIGYLPQGGIYLYVYHIAEEKLQKISHQQAYDELMPTWSPDALMIAYLSNRHDDPDKHPGCFDLFVTNLDGEERKLSTPYGRKANPSFSPDGKWIAYYGSEGRGNFYKNQSLWVVQVDGSAPTKNISTEHDLHIGVSTITDMGGSTIEKPCWSPDSQKIFFQHDWHGSTHLSSLTRNGKELESIITGEVTVAGFSMDASQNHLVYLSADMANPGDIFLWERGERAKKRLTRVNEKFLSEITLAHSEMVWYSTSEAGEMQGWILHPPNFDPETVYPAVLMIHGGPYLQYGFRFMHVFQVLAAQGFIVFFTNPRGSRGYGEAFTEAIFGKWGKSNFSDLMAWTDNVVQKPYISKGYLGISGGSHGGYMTIWTIGHTHRFKAAVAERLASNLIDMWGSGGMNWAVQLELNDKPPYEDFDTYWEHSPINHIGKAQTPTLVIHGEADFACPVSQSELVFTALKYQGVETKMIRFPGAPHRFTRTGRPDQRIDRLQYLVNWFNKHLKP